MTTSIPQRVSALREQLKTHGLTHYYVPSSDEHINEYLPAWGDRRAWISGFTGSAGDALVGLEEAWLFTDGRYHLQAEQELSGTGFSLSKVGAPGHQDLEAHLATLAYEADAPVRVGYDPMVVPMGTAARLEAALAGAGGALVPIQGNLVDAVWTDRPAPVTDPLIPVPEAWLGEDVGEKLGRVRALMDEARVHATAIVKLDQLAWLTNLRSLTDIDYNPVFQGYGWVDGKALHLFLDAPDERLPESLRADMPGLVVHEYGALVGFLESVPAGTRVLLDPMGTTAGVEQVLAGVEGVELVHGEHPVETAKALKSAGEQAAMRRANRLASAAKTRALMWLEDEIAAGREVSEAGLMHRLEAGYRALDGYQCLSFNTISGTGPNGAIIHYKDAGEATLERGHLFLVDSGAQVAGGTTDDTRTVAVGSAGDEERRCYTLVLKAHMAAARMRFPAGTPGSAIDAICRAPMWAEGLTYDHGTGHGVGCFLNVHEGPFAISEQSRKPYAQRKLEAGMVTSIEPGYYREGWGGIRLENLYLVVDDGEDERGRGWLRFEPLTFIPFDRRLIDESLLDAGEKAWLDAYHARVREELAGHLEPTELARIA